MYPRILRFRLLYVVVRPRGVVLTSFQLVYIFFLLFNLVGGVGHLQR